MRLGRNLVAIVSVCCVGVVLPRRAAADEWNKKTVLTFSQAVEVPGRVLPAGTYVFQLADCQVDRHLVQVFDRNGHILAMFFTVSVFRPLPTDVTRITFNERSAGTSYPIKTWFYPGRVEGEEFIYPSGSSPRLTD